MFTNTKIPENQFLAINLILGYTFQNKTQKQKRQMVSNQI